MSGVIQLESAEISVNETDDVVLVAITRTGDLSEPVTVTYGISDDTATNGADYSGSSGAITIPAGADRVQIPVVINDDNASESTETFVVSIISVDSGFLQAPRTTRVDILDDENPVTDPAVPPLESDYDIQEVTVFDGLSQPIAFEFAPQDPDLVYVAEKNGLIKTMDLSTGEQVATFIDLRDEVNNVSDRGLMDIALHPDFPAEPYVYAYYVVDPPETQGQSGLAGPDGNGNRYAHVVRYEADASTGYTTVVEGSETVIVGGAGQSLSDISGNGAVNSTNNFSIPASDIDPDTGEFIDDYIKVDSQSHAGGALAFGPDGMLYIATGDGTSFNAVDERTTSVQDVDSLSGKVLRVDPITGEGLEDNPFYEEGDSLDSNSSKVYQLGLRNPFSMGFDDNGQLFVTDTGWFSYEEINSGEAGANFGWPYYEGGDNGVLLETPRYSDLDEAQDFYDAVEAGDIEVTAPYRGFSHRNNDPGFQAQAITGGDVVYGGDKYPTEFQGDYFFTDVSQGEVYTVDVNDRREVEYLYTTDNNFGPVHFTEGPDGYVYYADIATGEIGYLEITDPLGPKATDDFVDTDPNQSFWFNVLENDVDVNGGGLTSILVSGAANGALQFDDDGDVFYQPDAGFVGTETIVYDVVAADGRADRGVLEIQVGTPGNSTPNAVDDADSTGVDEPFWFNVLENDTDPDGDELTATLIDGPDNGTIQFDLDGDVFYTPNAGFQGVETITYRAEDGNSPGDEATYTITVGNPGGTGPTAVDDADDTDIGEAFWFNVLENDIDPSGGELTSELIDGPDNGTIQFDDDGDVFYTPDDGFQGLETITYRAVDQFGASDTATYTIQVGPDPDNNAPTARDDADSTLEGEAFWFNVLENDTDPDGDELFTRLIDGPDNGMVQFDLDGDVFYTPDAGFTGTETLVYEAFDDNGGVDQAVYTITVEPDLLV